MRGIALSLTPVPPLRVVIGGIAVAASAALIAPDRLAIACALGWTLLALALIDWQDGILPDLLTLPLAAAGVIAGGLGWQDALIGAVVGAGLLAVPAVIYRAWRGRDGLGWGDVKLAAASGAWLGWRAMPNLILASALLGILAVLLRRWRLRTPLGDTIPFGPALAAATWSLWL